MTCDRLLELHPGAHKGFNKYASALCRCATDTEISGHALLQVLKFVTCDRLFELHPGAHEGRLALRKDAIVSNVALGRTGLALRLHSRLTAPFRYSPDTQSKTFISVVFCCRFECGARAWAEGVGAGAAGPSHGGFWASSLFGRALWNYRKN